MNSNQFGATEEGHSVDRVRISAGGLTAHVLTWGAVVQNLELEGHDAPLVLGFDRFDDYLDHSPFFGATVGRYANRIRDGHFLLEGEPVQADRNHLGKHLLHGGAAGIGRRVWSLKATGDDFVTLTLNDPDGAMGFPGNLNLQCTYRLKPNAVLSLEITGRSDRTTLCNLAHHSYFNLDNGGAGDCLEHRVMISAGAYLPVDDELIPTGVVQPVDGTVFDFRNARVLWHEENGSQTVYDHNFCLSATRGPLRQAAWVQGAQSGIEMEVWTTEPGLQFYAGHKLNLPVPGLGGRSYGAFAGFCMEPQIWPDSPNRGYFPQAVLHPGETYRQETEYRFRQA